MVTTSSNRSLAAPLPLVSRPGPASPRRSGEFSAAESWATASLQRARHSSTLEEAQNWRPALRRDFHWLAMWLWLDKSHDSFFFTSVGKHSWPFWTCLFTGKAEANHTQDWLRLCCLACCLLCKCATTPSREERWLWRSDVCRGRGMDLAQQHPSRVHSDMPWVRVLTEGGTGEGIAWGGGEPLEWEEGREHLCSSASYLLFTLH